jgi:pyruvate kinase
VIRHRAISRSIAIPNRAMKTASCLPHPELFGILQKGQRLLIDDGKLRLRVIRADNEILCLAEVGGVISDRKGVNVPDAVVPVPALTERTAATWPLPWSRAPTGSRCSCSARKTWQKRAA